MDNFIQITVFCPPQPRVGAFVERNAGKDYRRQFYTYEQKKVTTEGMVAQLFLVQLEKMAGDRFHMTSRRPYLCTKQWSGGHVGLPKKACRD